MPVVLVEGLQGSTEGGVMTTSITPSDPARGPRVPLRISLNNGFTNGELAGAWWPQSRDFGREVGDLVEHLPGFIGRIARLMYSRPDWDVPSGHASIHLVETSHGSVRVGSFAGDDTHVIALVMASGERLRLLVIPPDRTHAEAATIMERAADERSRATAQELLDGVGPDEQS